MGSEFDGGGGARRSVPASFSLIVIPTEAGISCVACLRLASLPTETPAFAGVTAGEGWDESGAPVLASRAPLRRAGQKFRLHGVERRIFCFSFAVLPMEADGRAGCRILLHRDHAAHLVHPAALSSSPGGDAPGQFAAIRPNPTRPEQKQNLRPRLFPDVRPKVGFRGQGRSLRKAEVGGKRSLPSCQTASYC